MTSRYIPEGRWSEAEIGKGCGYAIVTRGQAERWMMAPSVAGGWIAVGAPLNYFHDLISEIVESLDPVSAYGADGFSARAHPTARLLENWYNRATIFLAALPSSMMEGRKMPLTPDELEKVAEIIERRHREFAKIMRDDAE